MASIYGSAVIIIAAASPPDSRGGLFYDRDPVVVQPFAAYVSAVPGLAEGWYLWKNSHRWAAVGEQPLHRRGWVLRERLLSARTVHFSRTEVVWHCLEDLASEAVLERPAAAGDGLEARMEMAQVGDYTDMRMTVARAQQDGLTERHRAALRLAWKKVLAHYTRCGLTQQRDKLVALSGIVHWLEEVLGDECLAGLWRGEMPACLAWYADWGEVDRSKDERQVVPQPEAWLAPSWSWASRNIPIEYPQYNDETVRHATVMTAVVKSQTDGLALSGQMRIMGPLVELSEMKKSGEVGNEVHGELGFVGDGIEAIFTVWMDSVVSHVPKTTKALLILEDYRFFFLLLQQLPGCDEARSGAARFQRIGLGLMEREFWAGADDVEALGFISRATSEDLDVKRSTWARYVRQIELE